MPSLYQYHTTSEFFRFHITKFLYLSKFMLSEFFDSLQ